MRFTFKTRALEQLYTTGKGERKYPSAVVDAFFDVMTSIAAAVDERDLYALKSLHYEKLKGSRAHQHSLRLNRQFRLIVEREQDAEGRFLLLIDIEDYH